MGGGGGWGGEGGGATTVVCCISLCSSIQNLYAVETHSDLVFCRFCRLHHLRQQSKYRRGSLFQLTLYHHPPPVEVSSRVGLKLRGRGGGGR